MGKVLLRKVLSHNIEVVALYFCREPLTGYGVIGKIQTVFGVRLSPATVYNCLDRLERDRLVSSELVNGKHGTRQSHSYMITEQGRRVLVESVAEMRFMLQELSKKG